MVDLVATCPKDFWEEWIAEGDAAGDPWTGETWCWFTQHRLKSQAEPGDRLYIVAHGRLRGYATITGIYSEGICRQGDATACTIPEEIKGFRGLRKRWWDREDEHPFPNWREPHAVDEYMREQE